jgi:hypothetical protein
MECKGLINGFSFTMQMFSEGGAKYRVEQVFPGERKPILLSNQSRLSIYDEVTKLYPVAEESTSSSSSSISTERLEIRKNCPCRPISEFNLSPAADIEVPERNEVPICGGIESTDDAPGCSKEGEKERGGESSGRRSSRRSGSDSGSGSSSCNAKGKDKESSDDISARKSSSRRTSSSSCSGRSGDGKNSSSSSTFTRPSPVRRKVPASQSSDEGIFTSSKVKQTSQEIPSSLVQGGLQEATPNADEEKEEGQGDALATDQHPRKNRKRSKPSTYDSQDGLPTQGLSPSSEKYSGKKQKRVVITEKVLLPPSSSVAASLPDIGDPLFQDRSLCDISPNESLNKESYRAVVADTTQVLVADGEDPVFSPGIYKAYNSTSSSSRKKKSLQSKKDIRSGKDA